jgi:4-diphosphocytidyl-2C-methyl-D-erythritol kinase
VLDTSTVYRAWDDLGGPEGPVVAAGALPPVLREYAPLSNDLYPAAVAVAPEVDEWRSELSVRWGVPVAMTGSGAALFACFPTHGEAEGAAAAAPSEAIAARAVEPVPRGFMIVE